MSVYLRPFQFLLPTSWQDHSSGKQQSGRRAGFARLDFLTRLTRLSDPPRPVRRFVLWLVGAADRAGAEGGAPLAPPARGPVGWLSPSTRGQALTGRPCLVFAPCSSAACSCPAPGYCSTVCGSVQTLPTPPCRLPLCSLPQFSNVLPAFFGAPGTEDGR